MSIPSYQIFVRELALIGLAPEHFQRVVMAFAKATEADEERKAHNRNRVRRQRAQNGLTDGKIRKCVPAQLEAHNGHKAENIVPPSAPLVPPSLSPIPPNTTPLNPPTSPNSLGENSLGNLFGDQPKEKKTNGKAKRTLIPEDFEPDFGALGLATDLGLDVEVARKEFIDFWKGNGDLKADWQATFRNRLRQLAERRQDRAARTAAQRPNVRDVTAAVVRVGAFRKQAQA